MSANIVSSAVGVVVGGAAFVAYYKYLSTPESITDWVVDLSAGLTTGIIFFFLAWGHFQKLGQGGVDAGE